MLRDGIHIFSLRFFGAFLWLIYTVVIARLLDPGQFAISSYSIGIILLLTLVGTMGNDTAILRVVPALVKKGPVEQVKIVLWQARLRVFFSSIISCSAYALVAANTSYAPLAGSRMDIIFVSMSSIVSCQMSLNRDVLRSIGHLSQSQIGGSILRAAVPALVSPIFNFFHPIDATASLAIYLIGLLCGVVFEIHSLRRVKWRVGQDIEYADFHISVLSTLKNWPGDVASAFFLRSVGLLVGYWSTPEQSAQLMAAERVASLAQIPISAVSQVSGPRISQAISGSKEEAQVALDKAAAVAFLGGMGGFLGVIVMGYSVLVGLGPHYAGGYLSCIYMALGQLSWAFFGGGQIALTLSRNSGLRSLIACFLCLGSFASILLSGIIYGNVVAASVFCASCWVANIFYVCVTKKITGLYTGFSKAAAVVLVREVRGKWRGAE